MSCSFLKCQGKECTLAPPTGMHLIREYTGNSRGRKSTKKVAEKLKLRQAILTICGRGQAWVESMMGPPRKGPKGERIYGVEGKVKICYCHYTEDQFSTVDGALKRHENALPFTMNQLPVPRGWDTHAPQPPLASARPASADRDETRKARRVASDAAAAAKAAAKAANIEAEARVAGAALAATNDASWAKTRESVEAAVRVTPKGSVVPELLNLVQLARDGEACNKLERVNLELFAERQKVAEGLERERVLHARIDNLVAEVEELTRRDTENPAKLSRAQADLCAALKKLEFLFLAETLFGVRGASMRGPRPLLVLLLLVGPVDGSAPLKLATRDLGFSAKQVARGDVEGCLKERRGGLCLNLGDHGHARGSCPYPGRPLIVESIFRWQSSLHQPVEHSRNVLARCRPWQALAVPFDDVVDAHATYSHADGLELQPGVGGGLCALAVVKVT